MADSCPCSRNCPCACTNISIMQLFHELKQKFPAVPDRVINECIRKNGHRNHDKEACESALEKENHAYLLHSYPPSLASKMTTSATDNRCDEASDVVGCRCFHQDDGASRFDRRLPGRQSLDSLCRRQQHAIRKSVTIKHHYSDESLHRPLQPASFPSEHLPMSHSVIGPFVQCSLCSDRLISVVNNANNSCNQQCERTLFHNVNADAEHKPPVAWENCEHATAATSGVNRSEFMSGDGISRCMNCCARGDKDNSDNIRAAVSDNSVADMGLKFASDTKSCHRCIERTSVSVSSCCSARPSAGPHSAPVTPSGCHPSPSFPPLSVDVTTPRHRTALSVEPLPPYLAQLESRSQRPFTRVNLTLRPPSSDPQPPIDIRSAAGGLTYLTCSYDPRQGYRSRLQISIGPHGQGSVSAARTGASGLPTSSANLRAATSMPDVAGSRDELTDLAWSNRFDSPLVPEFLSQTTQATVSKQLEQKQRLERELQIEKENLRIMRQKVADMEQDLKSRLEGNAPSSRRTRVQELRDEILRLRNECKVMTAEVDLSSVPLGETREDFYKNIYRGPEGTCLLHSRPVRLGSEPGVSNLNHPDHHRLLDRGLSESAAASGTMTATTGGCDGPNWTCYVCTFRNHPLLDKCEQCEMPRIVLGTSNNSNNINAASSELTGAQAQVNGSQQLNINNQLTNNNNNNNNKASASFVH